MFRHKQQTRNRAYFRGQFTRNGVEKLEDRQLMAGDVGAVLGGGLGGSTSYGDSGGPAFTPIDELPAAVGDGSLSSDIANDQHKPNNITDTDDLAINPDNLIRFVQLDSTGRGQIRGSLDFPGQRDRYQVSMPNGVYLQTSVDAIDPWLDTYVRVYTTFKNADYLLAENDDHHGTYNSHLELYTGRGVYTISVGSFGDIGTGDYELRVQAHVMGDASGNGVVDFADFLILSRNWTYSLPAGAGWYQRFTDGDFNADGYVDFVDFLMLSSHFGDRFDPTAVDAVFA